MQKFIHKVLFTLLVLTAPFVAASAKENNGGYNFKVSGFVNLTMCEDFGGVVNNMDFISAAIDPTSSANYDNQFRMDFSTSRFNFDASKESEALGLVELHLDVDFRGGNPGSYTPRMRTGYIKVGGFMVGKYFSHFADLDAMLYQVDFQGPVGYSFLYTPQIRYTHTMSDDHITLSAALEYIQSPVATEIAGSSVYQRVEQKLPTIPAYAQYSWGETRNNYVRFSAMCRPQSVYNVKSDEIIGRAGWGTQISGRVNLCDAVTAYYNGIYGKGISEYISDLYGSGLEYTFIPTANRGIETTAMYGYNAGLQFNLSKSMWCDVMYSEAIQGEDCDLYVANGAGDGYYRGRFASANLFYKATQNLTFATEYIWGSRENMNGDLADANRIYLMAQYNF